MQLLPPHPRPVLSLGGRSFGVGSAGLRERQVLVGTSTAPSQAMGKPWESHEKPWMSWEKMDRMDWIDWISAFYIVVLIFVR